VRRRSAAAVRNAFKVSLYTRTCRAWKTTRSARFALYLYVLALCLCQLSLSAEFSHPAFDLFWIVLLPLIGVVLAWQALPTVLLVAIGLFVLGTVLRSLVGKPRAVAAVARCIVLIMITIITTLTISRGGVPLQLGFQLHRKASEDVLQRQPPRIECTQNFGWYQVESCWEGEGGAAFFSLGRALVFIDLWSDRQGFAHMPDGSSAWWMESVRRPTQLSGDWYHVVLDEDQLRLSTGPATAGDE
jgi:hypothetical protein